MLYHIKRFNDIRRFGICSEYKSITQSVGLVGLSGREGKVIASCFPNCEAPKPTPLMLSFPPYLVSIKYCKN